jgi:outer membrane immunogenic protein
MRTLFLTTAAAVLATAAATPALAQDVDPTFTGPRVGGILGYDIVTAGTNDRSGVPGDDQTVHGLLYGVDAGYDVALGNAVVGIEGEYSDSTGKVSNDRSDPNYYGFGRVKTGRDLYVGARVGMKVNPTTLAYVKGGYTNQRLNLLAGSGDGYQIDDHYNLDGWRLGAGVEHAMSRNTYIKAEYRYSNYSRGRFNFGDGSTSPDFDVDTDRHQIVAGFGLRF